jgi:hypothetical protein
MLSLPGVRVLYGTLGALILALLIQSMPFGVQMLKTSFALVAAELEQASRVCGAGWLTTYRRVMMPLVAPMLVSIFILVFIAVLRDISTSVLLAGASTRPLSLLMLEFARGGNLESAAVVGVILAAIVVRCAETVARSVTLTVLGASLSLLVIMLLMGLFLIEVYRPGPITRFRVGGAVAAYLLLGLTWAYVYALVEFQAPGSLRFPDSAAPGQNLPRLRADVAYFSFTTLTTLGYGDILPVSPFARSMAVLEALVGQLFVATLIARLVSLRPPSPTREEDDKPSAR